MKKRGGGGRRRGNKKIKIKLAVSGGMSDESFGRISTQQHQIFGFFSLLLDYLKFAYYLLYTSTLSTFVHTNSGNNSFLLVH